MIEVKNMNYHYAGSRHQVFRDFNLSLQENRIYGLLGKNGTGKSTLLYLISGLLRAQSGEVSVDGVPSKKRMSQTLSEVFIVPEEYDLPDMSLKTFIKINRPFYPRFSEEVLNKCLTAFEMPTKLHLKKLSMGQKKKVYMSFALATGTRFLLMDEPTNGLDIPSKSLFRRVIAENMTDDRTLIISTHQVHDVEQLLDHVMILSQSGLIFDMPTGEIGEKFTFALRQPGDSDADILYCEPSLQGNACISRRKAGDAETQINLELLFNAATMGKL